MKTLLLIALPATLLATAAHAQPCEPGTTLGTIAAAVPSPPTDAVLADPTGEAYGDGGSNAGARFQAPCDGVLESITLALRRFNFYNDNSVSLGIFEGPLGELVYPDGGSGRYSVPDDVFYAEQTLERASGYQPVTFSLREPLEVESGSYVNFLPATISDPFVKIGIAYAESPGAVPGAAGLYSNLGNLPDALFSTGPTGLYFVATFGPLSIASDVEGFLAFGACPSELPAGEYECRLDAGGTYTGDAEQAFTAFLRIAETGRIALRREVRARPGQSILGGLDFRSLASDPSAFSLELVVDRGDVPAPTGASEVLAALSFTKNSPPVVEPRQAAPAVERLTVTPNPTANTSTLRFDAGEAADATLSIYDALGREVARPLDGTVTVRAEVVLDVARLPVGVYLARLVADGRVETAQFTVLR